MASLWEQSNDQDRRDGSGEMELFLKHIEQMRRFFEAHEVVVTIQVVPVQELAAYDASHARVDGGGTHEVLGDDDWMFLVPLRGVSERQVVAN
jgi:hypothetical protein